MPQVELGDVRLAVGDLAEGLEDLLRCVLVLGHVDHEADEGLEGDGVGPAAGGGGGGGGARKMRVHLGVVVDEAEAGEGGGEFDFLQGVAEVAVEVAEDRFELLELDGGEVGHVAGDELVFEEDKFLGDGGFDEAEFVGELVVGVGCEVVLFNVGFLALSVEVGEGFEEGVKRGKVRVQTLDVGALVVNVAFEAGDGEGESVESEREIVGFIGKRPAKVIFNAGGWLVEGRSEGKETDSRMVSLMIWLLSLSDPRRVIHS